MPHAWYSEKQVARLKKCNTSQEHGVYKVYATEDGREVRTTMVSETKNHDCKFDDIIYLGLVERFLRCEN